VAWEAQPGVPSAEASPQVGQQPGDAHRDTTSRRHRVTSPERFPLAQHPRQERRAAALAQVSLGGSARLAQEPR